MLDFNFSMDDVNLQTATRAFHGTSFSPEKRGKQRQQDYFNQMQAVKTEFEQWVTEENAQEMSDDLNAYKVKYLEKFNAYLHAHGRVMSTMIAGPARFPTRSNRKKSDTADKRMNELIEFNQKRIQKLERKYNPQILAHAPIMAGDSEALTKLRAKLSKLEAYHAKMKAYNKIVKRKAFKSLPQEEQIKQLIEVHGLKAETAHSLTKPDYMGRIGIPGYALTNNSAEMRRIRGRIVELERLAGREASSDERPDGITVERDPEAARIRLIFPGKPDAATRKLLKSNGLRFAPSVGAWQRQLNSNGESAIRYILQKLEETPPTYS